MNFEELKTKTKELWVKINTPTPEEEVEEDTPKQENPLNMQMLLLRFVLGFAGTAILIQAIVPELLTRAIFTIPNGEITFMSMLPICILFITVYMSSNMLGGMIIDWALRFYDDLKNRIPVPTMLRNMLVPIVVGLYVAYKLYYPTLVNYIVGVR